MADDRPVAGTEYDPEGEEEALARALEQTPRGTVAVAGTAVGLLILCWFAIYLFVFLPRGTVG